MVFLAGYWSHYRKHMSGGQNAIQNGLLIEKMHSINESAIPLPVHFEVRPKRSVYENIDNVPESDEHVEVEVAQQQR